MNNQEQSLDNIVTAKNVSKSYDDNHVLDDINFNIGQGEIVGLIGPNGAGKSTLLKAIMGLIKYSGDLSIFNQNPFKNRTQLLQKMSYVADVASLPSWMKVDDILEFVAQTHSKFNIEQAKKQLIETKIDGSKKIETLSKGMKTRLHLIIILSIDTDFLVLDEPTLGLDVLVRRDFQDRLIEEYYNKQRSILITTHQVDEVESILTRVLFINDGKIVLDVKKSELSQRYKKLIIKPSQMADLGQLKPIYQRQLPEYNEMIFENADDQILAKYGELQIPSLEDLFVATNTQSQTLQN